MHHHKSWNLLYMFTTFPDGHINIKWPLKPVLFSLTKKKKEKRIPGKCQNLYPFSGREGVDKEFFIGMSLT